MNKNVLQRMASLQLQNKNNHHDDVMKIMAGDNETIKHWSVPLTNEERAERNDAVFDHWLAGETTTEIADKLHLTRQLVDIVIDNAKATRLEGVLHNEQPPIYNVWNYASCDPRFGQKHPGQIPGQAVVNLLLWLTEPFDVVVEIHREIIAFEEYARRRGTTVEQLNPLLKSRLDLERQAGARLEGIPRNKGKRTDITSPNGSDKLRTAYKKALANTNITNELARLWQIEASVPEDIFNQYQQPVIVGQARHRCLAIPNHLPHNSEARVPHNSTDKTTVSENFHTRARLLNSDSAAVMTNLVGVEKGKNV